MSQQPDERSQNYPDDSLTPLGHQNPLGVHHGLGQLGLQTKGLAGGSSLSILDPDIFFPNGLPEIDLSSDEVTLTHQSSLSEQATSTTPSIQPQRIEPSQSHKTNTNQSPQQQSSQPNHQLNKQPSNQHTNQTSQLQINPPNAPAIQPSLDNAPGQSAGNQANSAPSPHPVQRTLSDQPETIPQSAQSLEQTQPAAESSSPHTIQAKEITPISNSAELGKPNQATYQLVEPAQPKLIEAVSRTQSPDKQQSSDPPRKDTERLTHTDIQRYFDPESQTLSDNIFSDRSINNSNEQVIQAKSLADESNTDTSSSPSTESGLVDDAYPTQDASSGNAIAPAQPSSSATEQRLVGDAHPMQISSRDAIAPTQPSLTTSDQQISRSASEPISQTDQQSADNHFAASDSTSHSQELPATTPEASQQAPSIQRDASTSDSSSTPQALQQAPSIQQVAATSNGLSPINPDHQSSAINAASEQAKTNLTQEIYTSPNPTPHNESSNQAGTTINRKAVSSSTSDKPNITAENSFAPTNINSTNESTSIQRQLESSQANDNTSPASNPSTVITPAPQNAVNRSADEQASSVTTPSTPSESSEPKSSELNAQPPSSTQRKTETNQAPGSATRQERSFLQRYFSPDPKPSSSNSTSADSPQSKSLSSSQAANNPPANELPSNQSNPGISSVPESKPTINRSAEQLNPSPLAKSIEQSSITNTESHSDQIQRQKSLASSDIGSTEVRSQPQHSIQQDIDTAAATPEPHISSQIQQEPENLIDQFNSSATLSATSDHQLSVQAQFEPENTLVENQTDQPNHQQVNSAQINLNPIEIQQQSEPANINRSSLISEESNRNLEADDIAKGQSVKESLGHTISTNQSVNSVQPQSDTTIHQNVDFPQSETNISNPKSVGQSQPQPPANPSVKPIQKVGHAVNRLMRFFSNQVNPAPTHQTKQLNQTAAGEVQQSESADTSTTLSEDSRIEPSTLTSDIDGNSDTQPIQRYSENISDLNQPDNSNNFEDNVSSLQVSTGLETTFSTEPIINPEQLSSDTVRLKSDSEYSKTEQSSPRNNQVIYSGSGTTNLHEAAKPHVPDSATLNSTPDTQLKSDQTEATESVDSDNFQTDLAKVSESPPNQQIQASATGSITDSTTSSATYPSINFEAQSATSIPGNQAIENNTTLSSLAAEPQSQPSSSLRPDTIQRSEQPRIETLINSPTPPSTESETPSPSPSSNFVGQPDTGSAATSASPINTSENKAFTHLADDTIQTKTDSTQSASNPVLGDAVNQAAQVKNSISEPTRSAEIQSADHIQRSSQAGEFGNAIDDNADPISVENMVSEDQPSAIAPDPLSTPHTDTPHDQPLQRQIEDTSSVTAQSDTHLQRDIQQPHQQNHSVETFSSITSETAADPQIPSIQPASASSAEDAISVSSAPTTSTPALNETVQRFTDSNFTTLDETDQPSHTIASNHSEHSLDDHVSPNSSFLDSPLVQRSLTDQSNLNQDTDVSAATIDLSAVEPVHDLLNNFSGNNQQSFATEVSHQSSESSSETTPSIQASHIPTTQISSSEQSAQEVQEAISEGILGIQASSTQTAESQTLEQPDIQLQQDSDLESRSLPELENDLQRKPEPESTAISKTETTARPSVEPSTTPQPAAQTPSIQTQSTQASSTQAAPEQLATLGFNRPSAHALTVQAQSTQTDLEQVNANYPEQSQLTQTDSEQATVDHPGQAQSTQVPSAQAKPAQADTVEHPEQVPPSTQVPSVQAKPGQADPESAGLEKLEPNQPAAETSPAQISQALPLPAQTPSVQAQTSQSSPEQSGSEYLNPNQSSAPVPSVQAKSTQENFKQASSEYAELNQPSATVPSVQATSTQANSEQANSASLEPNQPLTSEPSVQATYTQANLEQVDSGQPRPLQPTAHTPDVQTKSAKINSAQPPSIQAQSSQTDSVQQPLVQAKSARTNAEQAASTTDQADQQVDQTPITVLQPIGILRSLTTTPISTTAIQSKASQDKQIQPQANTETNNQYQNANLEPSSYQDQSLAGKGLAGDSLSAHTASNAFNLQRQIAATESVLNEPIDAVQFQQANDSHAVQPEFNQGLADIQRQPSDQDNQIDQTNQVDSNLNITESRHSISQAPEQDSNGISASDLVQRSIEHPTAHQTSTDQPNQPVINRLLAADVVDPAANQQSIQPQSLLDNSVNQISGTSTTSETGNQSESSRPTAHNLQASPQVEQPVSSRTGSQEAISTPTNLVQRSSAEQAEQEASTQPNSSSDQIQRSPSAEAHQAVKPVAEPVQPAAQQPDNIQRDQRIDNNQLETATQPVQSLSQQQANPIQRSQAGNSQPADSSPGTDIPTQWSSLADLVEQTQRLSAPTPTEPVPGATSELADVQRQVDSSRAADSETIQDSTVDVVRGAGESAIAHPSPSSYPSPSSSIPTQWSSLEDLVQQMPSLESSADTVRQQAETAQPSQIQRKSTSQIKEKTPQASSAVSSQQKSLPKSQSTLQPVRQASKPRSTLSVSRVAPARSQSTPAPQTTVQAKFSQPRTNPGATLIQASEDEPFVTISRSGGGSEAAADYAEALELLAQEIYSLLRQRLAIEQERHGAGYPNRFR